MALALVGRAPAPAREYNDRALSTDGESGATRRGQELGHYRLGELLGEGGMGVVYRAVDEKLGRPVAIKLLHAERSADAHARTRFLREARAASTLDHPNIGTVYEIGESDGAPYIVMALYEGETLRARLSRGRIPDAESVAITRQLAAALAAAHQAGIVHRDLKPANVMLLPDGQLKLLDFGLAKLVSSDESSLTREGAILGTLAYMAPEQLRASSDVDARADLWALGALVYEILSGQPPFGLGPAANVIGRILSGDPPALPATAPRWLAAIALRLLSKDPRDRLASAQAVADQLAREEPPPPAPSEKRSERRKLWVGLAVLAFPLGIAVSAMIMATPPDGPSDAERASARQAYEAATAAFQSKDYLRAAALFEKSYQSVSEPGVFYNIAQSYRLAGDSEKAGTYYRKFLRTLPADIEQATPDQRALIKQFERLLQGGLRASPSPGE
jgi:serine/threonine protein kinase